MPPKTRFTPRHQYDDVRDAEEQALTDITCTEPSLTQQSFAEDADLNNVMRRYGVTDGAIPPQVADPRYYGDFTDAVDLQTAIQRSRDAVARFEALPADIRRRFDHDPVALHDFVMNQENREEAVQLGLLQKWTPPPAAPSEETPKGVT